MEIKIDDDDYQMIYKNSEVHNIRGPLDFITMLKGGELTTTQILDYIGKRTNVAFCRGYWRGLKSYEKIEKEVEELRSNMLFVDNYCRVNDIDLEAILDGTLVIEE